MDPHLVARVLSEIAEAAAETLHLQEVFSRVTASTRSIIPLDNMGVIRIVDGDHVVPHAMTMECEAPHDWRVEPIALTDWSPRVRPCPGPLPRIDDATIELDSRFPKDAKILGHGVRSALWQPFRVGKPFTGGVWLTATTPRAFADEHERVLRPIAAILGAAVDLWRLWDGERQRRERLEQLEVLLAALAESLDVSEVFGRLSAGLQPVLPHDILTLTELDEHAPSFRILATAGHSDTALPEGSVNLSASEQAAMARDHEILSDIPVQLAPDTERNRLLIASGMRSWLRVPVRLLGEVRGSVGFAHRKTARFGGDDIEVAHRIADRIALVLSHRQLALEARQASEARDRAERLEAAVETLSRELENRGRGRMVGVSKSWREVLENVSRVAPTDTTVLITGESGTGKEVVAHLMVHGSARSTRPFVAINCAALPETLLESELFGHERGAFTGATARKIGRIEQAASGTLFLDEIAEMSLVVQAKMLRVLQEREFQRVGGTQTLRADVRLLAATNRDLGALIARGAFREDLYYRLNVFEIAIPSLRDRPEDVLPMAEAFLEDLARSIGRPAAGISLDAQTWLQAYSWPGNVRELRNAIERAILLCDGGLITRDHLPAVVVRPDTAHPVAGNRTSMATTSLPAGGLDLADLDRNYVKEALKRTRGNKTQAARLLGLTRAQLYSRLERYGLARSLARTCGPDARAPRGYIRPTAATAASTTNHMIASRAFWPSSKLKSRSSPVPATAVRASPQLAPIWSYAPALSTPSPS